MTEVKSTVQFRLLDTYLAVIHNSVGTHTFRNLYATVNGLKTDITKNGELSCSFFASWVLAASGLIKNPHATVESTVTDLQTSGWQELPLEKEPPVGAVLVWAKKDFGTSGIHAHIGFYVGNGKAISNDEKAGSPQEHAWQPVERKIEKIFWHPKLAN